MPAKPKLLVLLAGAASIWGGTSALAAAPPRAELRDPGCQRAVDPPGRSVSITAVMRPMSGTERMALKFGLERRSPHGGSFTVLRGHNLGDWVHPADPTLGQLPGDEWMLKHNVVNLAGPAYYRFRVWFRWTGTGGRVLAKQSHLSAVCYQPEPRADLAVGSLTITSVGPQRDRYVALIRNSGATPAGPFTVELKVPSAAPQSADVLSLSAGASLHETFTGPACAAGGMVAVTADRSRQVDDANRKNNTLAVPCPG